MLDKVQRPLLFGRNKGFRLVEDLEPWIRRGVITRLSMITMEETREYEMTGWDSRFHLNHRLKSEFI